MSRLADAVQNLADEIENAERALDGDSNDAEHDALYTLTEAARGVIENWDTA